MNPPLNVNGIAQTGNLALCGIALQRALDRSSHLPGLVGFYGPTGWGKSVSANYIANANRAYYIQAKSYWTKKHFLKSMLFEMGIDTEVKRTVPEMADLVSEELAASNRPLIIDEMDHIEAKGLVDIVRDIYESSQAAILFIGEEAIRGKLKDWKQFSGRVLDWIEAQPGNLVDARKLAELYCLHVKVEDDLLEDAVNHTRGSIRDICKNLANIQEYALNQGLEVANRQNCAGLKLINGDVPRRRI
jgi:hypothetical protein